MELAVNFGQEGLTQAKPLRFFQELTRKDVRKPLKIVQLDILEVQLSDLYQIFLEFLQTLYRSCLHSLPLYLSVPVHQAQRLTFFYSHAPQSAIKSFRELNKADWPSTLLNFWKDIAKVRISDAFIDEYSVLLQEWQVWISTAETRDRLAWCSHNNCNQQGFRQFIQMFERLKVSRYFNLDLRLKEFLISSRLHDKIKPHELQDLEWGFERELRDSGRAVRQQFEATLKSIDGFIELLQRQGLVVWTNKERGGLISGSDEENQRSKVLKSQVNRCSETYHFFLSISISEGLLPFPKISLIKNENVVSFSRQFMRVCISLEANQSLQMKITTSPFWNIYPTAFSELRGAFENCCLRLSGQLLLSRISPRILDFQGLRLLYEDSKDQTKLSMSEHFAIAAGNDFLLELLGCVDKQLMIWAVLEKRVERMCRVYIGQCKDEKSSVDAGQLAAEIKNSAEFLQGALAAVSYLCRRGP